MSQQPRTIPNPLWCERCEGRGYLVGDVEWEPYAVQCPDCAERPSWFDIAPKTPISSMDADSWI
jgi:hypothetical protein